MKINLQTFSLYRSFGLVLLFFSISGVMAQEALRPNIIYILTDQWRGQALGFLHQEPVITPTIDSLAKQSLVLTQTIANYPLCSPSRASLFTGMHPIKTNVYANVNSNSTAFGVELPNNAITWFDVLKQQGYCTAYIGKWHLDSPHAPYIPTSNNAEAVKWNEFTPPSRRHGNDYWYAYGTYDNHLRPMYWDNDADRNAFHFVDQWGPEHEVDKAIEFLQDSTGRYRTKGKPFSLFLSFNPPHSVYKQVPFRYVEPYNRIPLEKLVDFPAVNAADTKWGQFYRENIRYYYAAMTGIDDQIRRLLQAASKLGLADNTIIIFSSDHGNSLGKNGQESKNTFFEQSLHVPFIIHWKNHIPARVDKTLLFSLIDVEPTLLSLLGIQNPAKTDGHNLSAFFLGKKQTGPDAQYFMGHVAPGNINSGFRGIRDGRYKLAFDQVTTYLFDYKKDPDDLHNLANKKPNVVLRLRHKLEEYLLKNKDTFLIDKQ
ncbi:Arylsulfatase A [bacterium A37T11]|nr:Arylsulfatase A [bacterium A37T11]